MRLISVLLFIALLSSCATYSLFKKEDLKKIPVGSSKVIALTTMSPDSCFKFMMRQMAKDGWAVTTNKEVMQISTALRSVQGGTSIKVNAFIQPSHKGSEIILSGEWGLDLDGSIAVNPYGIGISGTKTIIWTGDLSKKTNLAFQNLLNVGISANPYAVSYEK